MIRRLLNRIAGNAAPTARESIAEAIQAIHSADLALAAALDWTDPPMQPATEAEQAVLMRLRAYTLTARSALVEAIR